jgi:hypothetical protein
MDGQHSHALPEHEHPLPEHSHVYAALAHDHLHTHPAPHVVLWPTGTCDDAQLEAACLALPDGGLIELAAGSWDLTRTVMIDDDITLIGQGMATVLRPSPDFPADQPLILAYHDAIRPACHVRIAHLALRGEGCTNLVHGIDFCAYRSRLDDISIYNLTGDGLRTMGAAGSDGKGWGNYECVFTGLDINGCRYGIDANSGDQHWSDCRIHTNVLANVIGHLTGCMISNCHFFGGAQNPPKTQTVRNLHLSTSSRTRFCNCKIEHAAQELVWLDGNPKGGFVSFIGCGLRGGSSEAEGMYPQIKVSRVGSAVWKLVVNGCSFDADLSTPSWNIEAVGDCVRTPVVCGNLFANGATGAVTPNVPVS